MRGLSLLKKVDKTPARTLKFVDPKPEV